MTKRSLSILIFIALLLLSACAAVPVDDEEGGISGTGNAINCDEENPKDRNKCIAKKSNSGKK